MKSMKSSAAALVLMMFALPCSAECFPKRVLHVVIRIDDPSLPADHDSRKPTTMYRLGRKYGIMEQMSEGRLTRLVYSEPDEWFIDVDAHTGQHSIDHDPPFRAPVLAVESKHWKQMEIGCEVPYMKAVGAKQEPLEGGGSKYTHTAEGITVTLFTDKNDLPKRLEVDSPKVKYTMLYDVYEMLADDTPARFAKPTGLEFREAN